ncbi:MAG: DUF1499 domain-containing protein, partial [Pseudolabrys sp.]|nr:DUF1499 domain-containing protein [Pseudolabrys sp.]
YRAYRLPAVLDVTTNPANPPRFEVAARLRPRGTSEYAGVEAAAKQRAAYPDIAPLQVMASPKAAFDTAMAVVAKRKWTVVDARAPAPPGRREGTIEAIARSTIMGIRDDVVIRVTPVGSGSQVDVRSASRLRYHDFGDNAARIRALLEEIDDQVPTAEPAQKQAEPEKRPPQRRQPQSVNQRR